MPATLGNSTLVITVNGVAKTLNKVGGGSELSNRYFLREATQEFSAVVRHNLSAKSAVTGNPVERHNIEFVQLVFASGGTPQYANKAYFVMETEAAHPDIYATKGLLDAAVATSGQILTDLQGRLS